MAILARSAQDGQLSVSGHLGKDWHLTAPSFRCSNLLYRSEQTHTIRHGSRHWQIGLQRQAGSQVLKVTS
jgi:hypothetical protein